MILMKLLVLFDFQQQDGSFSFQIKVSAITLITCYHGVYFVGKSSMLKKKISLTEDRWKMLQDLSKFTTALTI